MEFFVDRLREELKIDEGCKYEVYLDHLGLPTFGIGHLITDKDPEHQMGIGTPVDEIRVNEAFEQDIQVTVDECKILFVDWSNLPEEVKLITKTINSSKLFFKKKLSKNSNLRSVPNLRFIFDDTEAKACELEELINKSIN